MTDAKRAKVMDVLDMTMRVATAIILAVLIWVGSTVASLDARVSVLDSKLMDIEKSNIRFATWLDWWHKTVPSLDATQTQRLSSVEQEVSHLRVKLDRHIEQCK